MLTPETIADLKLSVQCLLDSVQDTQSEIARAEVDELMDDAVDIDQAVRRLQTKIAALKPH